MARDPIAAGTFYEDDLDSLEKQIIGCFTHKLGPGDLPLSTRKKRIKAAIIPHAGYNYSGPCAAWAYKEIAESEFPGLFIILGPAHTGHGSSISIEDWKTPFGIVKVDKDFAIRLKENSELEINEDTHSGEHSIEVQLPFLQYTSKDKLSELKILPIALTNDINYKKFAKDLRKTIVDEKKEAIIIVSSDFTHYGPAYGYLPFSLNTKARLEEQFKQAFEKIKNLDSKGFSDFVNKTGDTICGFIPILVLLETLENTKAENLLYYSSGELTGSYKNSVSYASIIFR